MVGGSRFALATLLCDRSESEVWASEGRLEPESTELQEEKDGEDSTFNVNPKNLNNYPRLSLFWMSVYVQG